MSALIFDWETTGKWLPKGKAPQGIFDPAQPKPVQFAGLVIGDNYEEVASANLIVLPDGWTIPDEAAQVHGITQEKAERYGVPLIQVMRVLNGLIETVDNVVAHNAEYDVNVAHHALHTLGLNFDPFEGKQIRCTMKVGTRLLKIPKHNATPDDPYRFVGLAKIYEHFFGETFDGAHDAMNDVRATARVYRHICEQCGLAP